MLLEAHGGRMVHAGVGGADGGVEALGGVLVGARWPAPSARRWAAAGVRLRTRVCVFGVEAARVTACGPALGCGVRPAAGARLRRGGGGGAGCGLGRGRRRGGARRPAVNLRRSVTTKGLFCSDMSHTLSMGSDVRTAGCDGGSAMSEGKRGLGWRCRRGRSRGSVAVEGFAADVAEGELDGAGGQWDRRRRW